MASVNLFRGGTPVFRAYHCEQDFAEWQPPISSPRLRGTPPFNSHADGAHGQGYLNLDFPLVPNLDDTEAHRWMCKALANVSAVGDIIRIAWVPERSYLESVYLELADPDPSLAGVAVALVAERIRVNFATHEFYFGEDPNFTTAMGTANVSQLDLGDTTQTPYMLNFFETKEQKLATFGHNIVRRNASTGAPTAGWDAQFGSVCLGLKIVSGTAEKIALIPRGLFSLYFSAKVKTFEGRTQIG